MPKLDADYWNNRYLQTDTGWDAGSITTPLKVYFDQLTDKSVSILIPGAGNAHEAQYLAEHGFENVHVCDIAPVALENLRQRYPQFNASHLHLKNFFDLENLQFDLIVEQTFFCAIDPSLRKKYFEKMSALLKPGGRLVGVLFDDKLNDDRPPYGGSREEYLKYIPRNLEVKHFEPCKNSIPPRAGREIFMLLQKSVK